MGKRLNTADGSASTFCWLRAASKRVLSVGGASALPSPAGLGLHHRGREEMRVARKKVAVRQAALVPSVHVLGLDAYSQTNTQTTPDSRNMRKDMKDKKNIASNNKNRK